MNTDWLLEEILTGLQKLQFLRLPNAPASDGLKGCALTWIETLLQSRGWDMDRDRPLIRDAFVSLQARKPREGMPVFWPAPGELLAAMPSAPKLSAPYHRTLESAPRLEWDKNRGNKSPIAKAHCRFNSLRLGIPAPEWTALDSPEAERIYAQLCADYGNPIGTKGSAVARDSTPAPRVGPPDAAAPSDGPESDLGRDAERGDSLGEAVGEDDYGEHLGRRSASRDLPDCEAWEVYRDAAA